MDAGNAILLILGAVMVLSSLGVAFSRDNLYASLYMSVTLVLIAGVYSAFGLHPVFALITFIFVGAIGMVTVVVAATYRPEMKKPLKLLWIPPVVIVAVVLIASFFRSPGGSLSIPELNFVQSFPADYALLVVFFITLMILLMLSAIRFFWRGDA